MLIIGPLFKEKTSLKESIYLCYTFSCFQIKWAYQHFLPHGFQKIAWSLFIFIKLWSGAILWQSSFADKNDKWQKTPKVKFTHYLYAFMRSIENLCFPEANFEIVHSQVLHPYGHGILRSLGELVTSSNKYGWRSRKPLNWNYERS